MSDPLPEDLSNVDTDELRAACDKHERTLTSFFRSWPSLTSGELAELQGVYMERLRLAKHLGIRRKHRAP